MRPLPLSVSCRCCFSHRICAACLRSKKRNKKFFTESLRRVVEVLSLEEGAVPVGSFKHLAFLYPGDIDLFEGLFFPFTDRATAATRARHRIAVMARRIELESHRGRMFFADFKAGYDERLFLLSNAEMSGGPDDVDLEAFLARLQTAVETELVSDDRARPARTLARRMARATCDVTRRHDWTELLEATRKLYTLRWTLPELIAGRKRLPRGTAEEGQERVVTLEEALQSKSVVKIDVWALLQDELGYSKFAEVTNFWNFQYRDAQTGTIRSMTKEFNRSYIASLDADLAHYSQPAHFNPLRGKLNRRLGRFGPRQFIWEGSDTERYVGFSGEAAMAQGLGAGGRGDAAGALPTLLLGEHTRPLVSVLAR